MKKPLVLLLTVLTAVFTARLASAATDTWTGASDQNWQTAGNWSDVANAAPSSFDSLDFSGTATGLAPNNNFAPTAGGYTGFAVDGITFDNTGTPGAFTISGSNIELSGQVNAPVDGIENGINNTTSQTETFTAPISTDWGTYTIGNTNVATPGTIAINGGFTLAKAGVIMAGTNGTIATTLTTDAGGDGLISGLNGAGLIQGNAVAGQLALLPLATISSGTIAALPLGSYTNPGASIASPSATANYLVTSVGTVTIGAAATLSQVNTVTFNPASATVLSVTGTMVLGAGSVSGIGGLYETENVSTASILDLGSSATSGAATGWFTSGTTSAGGTIIIGVNSAAGSAANQVSLNDPIVDNATGGPVAMVKTGNGSMNIHPVGTFTYSGGTYVEEGLLQANTTGVLGTGPVYVAGGSTLYLETSQANNLLLSPGIGDASNYGALKFATSNETMSGTITLLGSPVTAAPGDRMSATSAGDTVTLSNQITGAGTLDLDSQGTTTAAAFALDNTTANGNNWTGGTIIENNSTSSKILVQDGASNQFGANGGTSAGNMTFSAGSNSTGALTFDLHGNSDTVGALITTNGTATVFVNNTVASTTSTLTIGDNGGTGTFGGIIEDTGAGSILNLIKTGGGTQTLSNMDTYVGSTSVTGGVLNITGSLNATSGVTVTTATLTGKGSIAANTSGITIGNGSNSAGSAILEPGGIGLTGTLTTTGAVSLLSDAAFVFNLNSTSGGLGSGVSELLAASVSLNSSSEFSLDDIAGTPGVLTLGDVFTAISTSPGTLTGEFGNLANGQILSVDGNDYQASYNPSSLTFTVVVVPEPQAWGLMLFGFGLLVGIQRLRKGPSGI